MRFNLDKLWVNLRRAVPNGVPNPKNAYHLVLLKEICLAKGVEKDVIDKVLLTLEQEDTFTAKSKKTGKVVAFGSEETRDKAIDSGDYEDVEKKDDKDSTSVAGPGLGNIKKYLGSDDENDIDDSDSETQSQVDKKPQANGYVGDKDKPVSQGHPSETEQYQK